jgi:hypothetical protein
MTDSPSPAPARRGLPWVAVVAALAVALIAGLGIGYEVGSSNKKDSGDNTSAQEPQVAERTEKDAAAEDPATTEGTPEESSQASELTLKDEADLTTIKVTVFKYERGITDPDGFEPEPGMRWDAALVRACNVGVDDPETIPLITSWSNWSLADGHDGAYTELDMTPSPAPLPQWSNEKKLAVGNCAKGWVAFDVAKGAKVVSVAYSVEDEEQARWSLN